MNDENDASLPVRVYEDLVHRSADEIGHSVHRAVKLALSPANAALWSAEQSLAWLVRKVSTRFAEKQQSSSSIVPPPPYLLGTIVLAVQGLGGDEMLMSWFAELLATSMDANTVDSAHLAFAEILRNLEPEDARFLMLVVAEGKSVGFPLNFAVVVPGNSSYEPFYAGLVTPHNIRPQRVSFMVANLTRLSLLEPFRRPFSDTADLEDSLQELWSPETNAVIMEKQRARNDKRPSAIEGVALTVFALHFLDACVPDMARSRAPQK